MHYVLCFYNDDGPCFYDDTTVADVAKAQQFHPYIVVKTEEEDSTISLATDGQIVTAVPLEDVPFTLMAAYFTYNICYPKGTINFFTFMEIVTLRYPAEKAVAAFDC